VKILVAAIRLVVGFQLILAASSAHGFYGMAPAAFMEKHWSGQNKFLTTIVAAEREGYLLDYGALAKSLSPWLNGTDSLIGEPGNSLYRSLVTRLRVKETDFVRFEFPVMKGVTFDLKTRSFRVCLSEGDIFQNDSMAVLRNTMRFQNAQNAVEKASGDNCSMPVAIEMNNTEFKSVLSERAREGVRATRSILVRGALAGVEPTRAVPSIMGYHWVFKLTARLDVKPTSISLQTR
jgi:hypothetical protein